MGEVQRTDLSSFVELAGSAPRRPSRPRADTTDTMVLDAQDTAMD